MNLPIACTLSSAELARRRASLLPGVAAQAESREPVDGGFRWRFGPVPDILRALIDVIEAERECCRFLKFTLTADPDGGPVWLEVTGPPGTAEFLDALVT
jgi:hypothetical protein